MTATSEGKRILILGAGLVSTPIVRRLLRRDDLQVTVASQQFSDSTQGLLDAHDNGEAVPLDISDSEALSALVARHDLVVSLLPATMHVAVAELCLEHGRNMATTSYISEGMRALDERVKAAGLVFLNECGVDPGVDHMSAMRIFDDVRGRGGTVEVFKSYCGGLPAPEANTNPLGYKFSWAPRGVLVAARNSARYLRDGELVEIPGVDLFTDCHVIEMKGVEGVEGAAQFEAYPNRDSLSYIETYGLEGVQTMFRGTLRNLGHCPRWKAYADLGLFDETPRDNLKAAGATYACVLRTLLGVSAAGDLAAAVASKLGDRPATADVVETLAWLGMFATKPLPEAVDNPLDALATAMLAKMPYEPGERDMIVMHHEVVSVVDGVRERTIMDLVDFGEPDGDSSMARTVSLPLSIGVELIVDGTVTTPGVHAPVTPEFYVPILDGLEKLGIVCHETTEVIEG